MNDAEVDQAVRLASEPSYQFVVANPYGQGMCTACGAVIADKAQHDAFHALLRGLVMGAGE